jgi:integrase
MKINGEGYIFSYDGGETPVKRRYIYDGLNIAFKKIGIGKDEIKERGLNVHAWRHFCNTELQKGGLTVKKVQAITGHKTEDMTEHYTHFDPLDFAEVPKIQAALLEKKSKKPQEAENERPAITLVRTKQTLKRKIA